MLMMGVMYVGLRVGLLNGLSDHLNRRNRFAGGGGELGLWGVERSLYRGLSRGSRAMAWRSFLRGTATMSLIIY
jgi:hypothetical protein